MTRASKRYLKFFNSKNGQSLAFDWLSVEDKPHLLIITNKINGLTLCTFEGTSIDGIQEMVVMF